MNAFKLLQVDCLPWLGCHFSTLWFAYLGTRRMNRLLLGNWVSELTVIESIGVFESYVVKLSGLFVCVVGVSKGHILDWTVRWFHHVFDALSFTSGCSTSRQQIIIAKLLSFDSQLLFKFINVVSLSVDFCSCPGHISAVCSSSWRQIVVSFVHSFLFLFSFDFVSEFLCVFQAAPVNRTINFGLCQMLVSHGHSLLF